MKIGSSLPPPTAPLSSSATRPTDKEEKPAHLYKEPGKSLDLSPIGAVLARVEQTMNEVPEVQWEKVEELRAAIQSGQFRVHPERIAERLLAEARELIFSRRSNDS